jgi:U4/U6 small nuclear ribonucleoprotein PRP4
MGKVSQQVPMPGGYSDPTKAASGQSGGPNAKEVFYSPASEQLIAMRNYICEYSFPRTHDRLLRTKRIRESEAEQAEEDHRVAGMYVNMRDLCLNRSEFGDDRPMCSVRFSPDNSLVAVGSWTGTVKLWDSRSLTYRGSLAGHEERVTSVSWQPEPVAGHHLLASSSADGKVVLWDCRDGGHMSTAPVRPLHSLAGTSQQVQQQVESTGEGEGEDAMETAAQDVDRPSQGSASKRVGVFEGHQGVVSRCTFHPSGLLMGSTGYDFTWRLWDVETTTELQLQDGHSRECNAIDFHHDGSLVVTGDLGGVVLVWDLRSGQSVQLFQGHIKKIVSASFNVNGYMVATGSTDNNVKVWDLRSKKCGYTLPAHSNAICDARFSSSGEALLTGSFDGTLKLWNTRNFDILKTLTGHAGKIMSCDISPDESCLVSSGYDRTVKLWAKDM